MCAKFSLKKTLKIDSAIAPFRVDMASRPGATKAW